MLLRNVAVARPIRAVPAMASAVLPRGVPARGVRRTMVRSKHNRPRRAAQALLVQAAVTARNETSTTTDATAADTFGWVSCRLRSLGFSPLVDSSGHLCLRLARVDSQRIATAVVRCYPSTNPHP